MSNENYSMQTPHGLIDRLALRKRRKMFEYFSRLFPHDEINSVLDVGITADKNALSSNYFEKFFPDKTKIIALSNQSADFLTAIYPGLQFKQGDAKSLPFANNSVDIVFSSAVIEHMGCEKDQLRMLSECVRTAKKAVFITTPNRWHPIEVHTLLPLIHWLPKKLHRKILNLLHLKFYAQEENLNLVDRHTLSNFCHTLGITTFQIKPIYTCGFISNLILVIHK